MPKTEEFVVPETDLRNVTRDSDKVITRVRLHLAWDKKINWLIFGQAEIRYFEKKHNWWLAGRFKGGVTDFEHSTIYAVRFGIIGLQFQSVDYHQTELVGWIDPTDEVVGFCEFHVPRPGYDPTTLKESFNCKDCKGKESHIIVPEGYYVPKFDQELFDAVKGKKIEISIGQVDQEP